MRKLSLLDFGFLIAESAASPKQVAGLLACKRPLWQMHGQDGSLQRAFAGLETCLLD